MFAGHELKVLNLSVIVYILLGALIFHSLGEFERPAALLKLPSSQQHDKPPPTLQSNGASGAIVGRPQATLPPTTTTTMGLNDKSTPTGAATALARLQLIRLNSVQRMWNITNKLNVLYESNWTELVLNELVDYERQFVESLERSVAESEQEEERSSGDTNTKEQDGEFEGPSSEDDEDGKKKKRDRKSATIAKRNEQRVRLESIKKSLVHSLATITTMGE